MRLLCLAVIGGTPAGNDHLSGGPGKVSFQGSTTLLSPTSWSWTFGDGGTASVQNPTHTYTTAGVKNVALTVSDGVNTENFTATVTVVSDKPPVAKFTFTPPAPIIGQKVNFHSTSTDPDGPIASLAWDLDNNGLFNGGTTTNVSKQFTTAGSHTVTLKVTDDLGAVDTFATNVLVNTPPTASFTFAPAHPIAGDAVTFTSTSSDVDGTIASTTWDLNGDGAYNDASGTTASRQFTAPGTFTVGIRVTDDRGAVTTATALVTVVPNKPPVALFTFTPSTPSAGDIVTLTSASTDTDGTVVKQEWDLNGDGAFDDAVGATVRRAFDAGPHRISLRVTDDRGATNVMSQTISVKDVAKSTTAPSGNGFTSPGPTAVPQRPLLLTPFPIVSLRGRIVHGGAIIDA